jgi:hypothetical protein
MVALDSIVAQQKDALVIRNQLPLEMGTDVPRASTEHIYASIVSGMVVAHQSRVKTRMLPSLSPELF